MLLHIFLASDLLSFSDLVHLPNRALYWFRGYKLVSPTYTIARAPSLYCHICLGKDLLLCPPRFCIFFSVSLGGHRVSIFKSESSLYFRCISNSKMPLKDGRYCSAPQSNIAISCGPGLFLFNVCFFFFLFCLLRTEAPSHEFNQEKKLLWKLKEIKCRNKLKKTHV